MNLIILGGGCSGSQYARRLLLARKQRKINFDRLIIVDRRSTCKTKKLFKHRSVDFIKSDWVRFLSRYIEKTPAKTKDLIVPSHAAPHLLGMAFFNLIKKGRNKLSVKMKDPEKMVNTPFERRLKKGVIAVSMAEWRCPLSCIEPPKCPHLKKKRNWDLEKILRKWAGKREKIKLFIFPARHYANTVSAIPAKKVASSWNRMKKIISKKGNHVIGAATSSACHGIISLFDVAAPSF
jgi:hypothetical protein